MLPPRGIASQIGNCKDFNVIGRGMIEQGEGKPMNKAPPNSR
jgi:hypothetical protein